MRPRALGERCITVLGLAGLLPAILVLMPACADGGAAGAIPPAPSAAHASLDGLGTTPPAGIDPVLWARLAAELSRVLEREGTLRRTSAAPIGKGSAVPDLGFMTPINTALFIWSYRQHGDYDLNGSVTISDLTPVGVHFGKTTLSSDWQQAQLADGDGNGEVNINDVTPIGQNFFGRVDGYELQSRPDPGAEWALASEHPFQPNDVPAGLYARYTSIIQNFVAGPEYRVVPYAQEGSGRSYGEPGNICRTLAADRCWATGRGNNNRDGRCAALGPDAAVHAWSLPLPGATMLQEPVTDMTGTIYIGMGTPGSSGAETGSFLAVNPDGSVRWSFRTLGGIYSTAAASRFGRVVVGDMGGNVYCLAPDGKQLWRRRLSEPILYSGALIDDDGIVYLITHLLNDGNLVSSTLCKLDPRGVIVWTRQLAAPCLSFPVFNNLGEITVVDQAGNLYSFAADGSSTQQFALPDPPANGMLVGGVLAFEAQLIYTTDNNSVRVHLFNNMFGVANDLGEDGVTMPVLNSVQDWAVGTRSLADVLHLQYYSGVNPDWTLNLPGDFMSNIAVDRGDNMYFGTFDGESLVGNGISCVRPDQTEAWFYPVGTAITVSVIVAADGLVVGLTGGVGIAESTLIGISAG